MRLSLVGRPIGGGTGFAGRGKWKKEAEEGERKAAMVVGAW